MKKFFYVICCITLCISLVLCTSACDIITRDDLNEKYADGYSFGYEEGYQDGWDESFDIHYDEFEYEQESRHEVLRLMFEATYNGYEIKDGEPWYAGNFVLRYHHEQDGYLHFDIKFTDFDIETICTQGTDYYMNSLPITCYLGFYEDDQYITEREYFLGENLCMDVFEFTEDGYLADYSDYFTNYDTLYILVFSNSQVYSAKYKIK